MHHWNLAKMGQLLREKRKQSGVKLKELRDEHISMATISDIETGKRKVGEKKVKYYCEKIGLSFDQLQVLLTEREEDKERAAIRIRLKLQAIEDEIKYTSAKQALRSIKEIQAKVAKNHEFHCILAYLTARCHLKEGKWEKAYDHYLKAIRLYEEQIDNEKIRLSNIKAASLHGIGRIYYRQNDLEKALASTEDGLKFFIPNGKRRGFLYALLINQAIFMEKIGNRDHDALQILEKKMWINQHEIDTEIKLAMYDLQATLYNKFRMHHRAETYAKKGIELARDVENLDRAYELYTTLGKTYILLQQFDLAKICFEMTSKLENKVTWKIFSVYNNTQLALLYLNESDLKNTGKSIENAISLAKTENDQLGLCEAFMVRADYYFILGNPKDAVNLLEEAKQIAEEYSFQSQLLTIILKLSQYYATLDAVKQQEYAILFCNLSGQYTGRDQELNQVTIRFTLPPNK
jgi:tetratricopeptide (TPR) repeat protein